MKTTKIQLQSQLSALQKSETAACIAMNELIRGTVQWFKLGKLKVGVCQPRGAHGGIVIQTDCTGTKPYSVAQYFEDWFKMMESYGPSSIPEVIQLRELSWLAQEFIRTEQAKA